MESLFQTFGIIISIVWNKTGFFSCLKSPCLNQHCITYYYHCNNALLIKSFLSGESDVGNSISNSITKSPFFDGSCDIGIPSPGTIFVYPGLKITKIEFSSL